MNINKLKSYLNSGLAVLFKPGSVKENPIYVQIEPTSYCNLNCKTCGRDEIIDKPVHLSFEKFKEFIDIVKPYKVAMSGTGEPFINPDLLKMVSYAKSKGCSVLVTSNFTLINDKMAREIVESGLDLLKISIDSANRDTYIKIRGKDYFNGILEGVDKINKYKKEKNLTNPHLRFQFVVQGENFKEIPDLIEITKEKEVEALYLQPLRFTFVEDMKSDLVESMVPDKLKEILINSEKIAQEKNIITNIPRLLKDFDLFFFGKNADKRICIMPWFSFYLSATGDVRPCCSFATNEGNLGNIHKEDFKEIWNNKKYKELRQLIKEGKYELKTCKDCVPPTLEDVVDFKRFLPGFLR